MNRRAPRASLWGLAFALLAAAPLLPAPACAAAPAIETPSPTIEASEDLRWMVPFTVHNNDDSGLYLDSLWLDVVDKDPGETRVARTQRIALTFLIRLRPSLSGNEDGAFQFDGPAQAEHGTLTFTLLAHDNTGAQFTRSFSVEAGPGPGFQAHPSEFLTVRGRRVETLFVPAPQDSQPAPGLLLIHGHGRDARHMLRMAEALAGRGYAVMLVSMPGYGQSQGPADFMGPATMDAAAAALDDLEHRKGVDPARLAVWGISRGATVAALLGEQRQDLRAVVAQSGVYDVWATARGSKVEGFAATIEAEAGRDSAAWRARSPLLAADHMHAPVLLLHGERDANVPAPQAHAFAAALEAAGRKVQTRWYAMSEHFLPEADVQRTSLAFLAEALVRQPR